MKKRQLKNTNIGITQQKNKTKKKDVSDIINAIQSCNNIRAIFSILESYLIEHLRGGAIALEKDDQKAQALVGEIVDFMRQQCEQPQVVNGVGLAKNVTYSLVKFVNEKQAELEKVAEKSQEAKSQYIHKVMQDYSHQFITTPKSQLYSNAVDNFDRDRIVIQSVGFAAISMVGFMVGFAFGMGIGAIIAGPAGASLGAVVGGMIGTGFSAAGGSALFGCIAKIDDKVFESDMNKAKSSFLTHFFKPKQAEEKHTADNMDQAENTTNQKLPVLER